MNLPELFTEKMRSLLGPEAEAFFEALAFESKKSGLRSNPLKIKPEALAKLLDIPLTPVPWCRSGFTYPSDIENRPSKNPLYQGGLYYLQEPSAMAPVGLLAPKPGDKVLDLCAAPGGKAAQIAGHLQGKGILVANDASATRSRALVKNLTLWGAKNAVIITEQPQRLAARFEEYFDKILIDAPCSGEGMFRKDPDAVKGWSANKPGTCVAMQREILRHAAVMVKPGGRMMYSTCTFDPYENEGTISEFLKSHSDFHIVAVDHKHWGFAQGRPDWVNGPIEISGAARLWPHRLDGEGHFLCLLEKKAKENSKMTMPNGSAGDCQSPTDYGFTAGGNFPAHKNNSYPHWAQVPSPAALELFKEFCENNLQTGICPNDSFLATVSGGKSALSKRNSSSQRSNSSQGSSFLQQNNFAQENNLNRYPLFAVPLDLPDLSGLRIARSGWYLGDVKKDRFEPSHALALALTSQEARFIHNFPSSAGGNCARYLRGETLDISKDHNNPEKAWVLVCLSGFPLGWARLVNGRLKNKNHYTVKG